LLREIQFWIDLLPLHDSSLERTQDGKIWVPNIDHSHVRICIIVLCGLEGTRETIVTLQRMTEKFLNLHDRLYQRVLKEVSALRSQ